MDGLVTPTTEEYQDFVYFLFLKFFSITPNEVDKLNIMQIQRFMIWYQRLKKKMTDSMGGMDGWESIL